MEAIPAALFEDVPTKVEVVKQIVDLAETTLAIELSSNIYLTLTDHIHYALLRAKEGIDIPNPSCIRNTQILS